MLDDADRERIRLEEVFRSEVRRSLAQPSTRAARAWRFLNSAIGIWLLSSVAVGLITWGFSRWRETRAAEEARSGLTKRLDVEIAARLRQAHQSLAMAERSDQTARQFAAFMIGQTIGGYPTPWGDSGIHTEFRGRPLLSLITQLAGLLPAGEGEALQAAMAEAEILNRTIPEHLFEGMESGFRFHRADEFEPSAVHRMAVSIVALLHQPRWAGPSVRGLAKAVSERRLAIAKELERYRNAQLEFTEAPALAGGMSCGGGGRSCGPGDLKPPPSPGLPAPDAPRSAPARDPIPATDAGSTAPPSPPDLPKTAPREVVGSLEARVGAFPDLDAPDPLVSVTLKNIGQLGIREGGCLVFLYSEIGDLVFKGRALVPELAVGKTVDVQIRFRNVLSPLTDTAATPGQRVVQAAVTLEAGEFDDGTVWPQRYLPSTGGTPGGSRSAPGDGTGAPGGGR